MKTVQEHFNQDFYIVFPSISNTSSIFIIQFAGLWKRQIDDEEENRNDHMGFIHVQILTRNEP